jgi:hypothetical protein
MDKKSRRKTNKTLGVRDSRWKTEVEGYPRGRKTKNCDLKTAFTRGAGLVYICIYNLVRLKIKRRIYGK